METEVKHRSGSSVGWIVAFLLFPYGPFVYLWKLRAIRTLPAIVLLIVSGIVSVGLVSVLQKTNDMPWQGWLVFLLGVCLFLLGAIQFIYGLRARLWTQRGIRWWRLAGWSYGMLLAASLLAQVLMFLLHPGNI